MPQYSRRFEMDGSRFMTRADIEGDCIVISQNERTTFPKSEYRSVVILRLEDFKKMIKTLGITKS